jgi:hypothetical protein
MSSPDLLLLLAQLENTRSARSSCTAASAALGVVVGKENPKPLPPPPPPASALPAPLPPPAGGGAAASVKLTGVSGAAVLLAPESLLQQHSQAAAVKQ